jgi:uncharacterized protein
MSRTMMESKPQPDSFPDSRDDPKSPSWANESAKDESQVLESIGPAIQRQPFRRNSLLHRAFVGPDGIYAIPRWLLYLAMAWGIFELESWLAASIQSPLNLLWSRMLLEASLMLAAILPGFVMARIEGCPFGAFGLPVHHAFRRNFWIGTLWGIVALTILMLALRLVGAFHFGTTALHGVHVWKFALYYAVLFLLTGFFEEFLVRGYSQWILTRGVNFWPAAVLLSAAFGAIHGSNPGENKIGLVAAGLIGLFLCLTLRRTGNLWWAVGFHMSWDWGESFFYSVPDSGTLLPGHLFNSSLHGPNWLTGGSVGPEGSYLVFVLIGALWVLFNRACPEVKYDVSRAVRAQLAS